MNTLSEEIIKAVRGGTSVLDNGYRYGSTAFFEAIDRARKTITEQSLSDMDRELLSTDIGEFGLYENESVPLDLPLYEEVELNSPKRGGNKKFYVYVKNDKGNVVKVEFGQPDMSVKFNDKDARASFNARHDCKNKNDKTTAGYWSCRLPFFSKQLGLSGGGQFFW
jgi:hypothetical protein